MPLHNLTFVHKVLMLQLCWPCHAKRCVEDSTCTGCHGIIGVTPYVGIFRSRLQAGVLFIVSAVMLAVWCHYWVYGTHTFASPGVTTSELLPLRVCCSWLCAVPVQHMRFPEQAQVDISPMKNRCDKQVSSWRHISCHTDKNRYYT